MKLKRTKWMLLMVLASALLALAARDGDQLSWAQGQELQVWTLGFDCVNSVAFSPDGRYLAAATSGSSVQLIDTSNWVVVRTFEGHTKGVSSVDFSPDNRLLVSSSADGTVKLWDVSTGSLVQTFTGHTGEAFYTVAFSPDGRLVAAGGCSQRDSENKCVQGDIKLWEVATRREVHTLSGHTGEVLSLDFSPDGTLLASGSWDFTVKIWYVATGWEVRTLPKHYSGVYSVRFSVDGRLLATADFNEIKLWDVATGDEVRSLEHGDHVFALAFSPGGQLLASNSFKAVKLWDVATGEEVRTLVTELGIGFSGMTFSPDGQLLALGARAEIKLWEVATWKEVSVQKGHAYNVYSVTFSPDGQLLASGGLGGSRAQDGVVKLWEVATGREVRTLIVYTDYTGYVYSVAFSPDGRLLASGGCGKREPRKCVQGEVKFWEVATGREIRTLTGHTGYVRSVAFSPDGQLLASGACSEEDNDGCCIRGDIKLWDVASGWEVRTFTGYSGDVKSVVFSPDGRLLASGGCGKLDSENHCIQGKVKLWDLATGREVRTIVSHNGSVNSVAFSPDGALLASGGCGRLDSENRCIQGDVKLWDTATWEEVRTLTGHTGQVWTIAFSPDGKLLASGGRDWAIRLWHVATGKEVRTLIGHTTWHGPLVWSVAFSPDGSLLASGAGGGDGTIKLWDVRSVANPPEISSVDFPEVVLAGVVTRGTIGFHDPDGDISQAKFEILEGALEGFTLDLTQPPYAEAVRGKTEGSFNFTLKVEQPGQYRIRVTLVDDAGLTSEPKEFSFEARTPTAPTITKVVFPSTINVNQEQNGIVKFEDPDGDIVKAEFEIIEGDPATIEVKPGMSFDPEVQGRTKGSFRFSVVVTKAQTVKLRLTLIDSADLRSEPYEFTFEVE